MACKDCQFYRYHKGSYYDPPEEICTRDMFGSFDEDTEECECYSEDCGWEDENG